MSQLVNKSEKTAKWIIGIISLAVLGLVVLLNQIPGINHTPPVDVHFFPKFHAILNSMVSVLLVLALVFIKQKNIKAHKYSIIVAVVLSIMFLLSYVYYHSITESTSHGGEGFVKTLYLIILFSHIVLAAAILPFILLTLYRALRNDFKRHRKIAKITWPIWLYVSVTGVIVYFMISPYY